MRSGSSNTRRNGGEKKMKINQMRRLTLLAGILSLIFLESTITMTNATIIVPPQKLTLQGGYEKGTEWVNGYWSFTVVVNQVEEIIGVELPKNTTFDKSGEESAYIKTNSSLKVMFEPVEAYYKRKLKRTEELVMPAYCRGKMTLGFASYDTGIMSETLTATFFEWGESSWKKFTTWKVSIFKNGNLLGQSITNTEDGQNLVMVKTNEGTIRIENLGRLEGIDTAPDTPNIVLFDANHIYTDDALKFIRYDFGGETVKFEPDMVVRKIKGSEAYSVYWTGDIRWRDGEAVEYLPAPFQGDKAGYLDPIVPMKGWKDGGGIPIIESIRDPVTPVIYPSEESDDIKKYDCLTEYLDRKTGAGNIAQEFLDNNWYIENDSVIAPIPWGQYSGSPLANVLVPTELVDSWVYRVPIADVRIEKVSWKGIDSMKAGIEDSQTATLEVTLKQYANVKSSAEILVNANSIDASVADNVRTETFEPNATKTLLFKVKNMGVASDADGTIAIIVRSKWNNDITSMNNELSYRLIPKVIEIPDDIKHPDDKEKSDDPLNDKPDNVAPIPIYENNTLSYAIVLASIIIAATSVIVTKMRKNKDRGSPTFSTKPEDKAQSTLDRINEGKKKVTHISDTLLETLGFKSLKDRLMPSIIMTVGGLTLIFVASVWYTNIASWLPFGFKLLIWWFDIPSAIIGFVGLLCTIGGILGIVLSSAIPMPNFRQRG